MRTTKKKPTAAENKLNALLGLTEKVEKVKANSIGKFYGVSEEEVQKFREAQGLIYFLQAPALFHPKVCKHCKEPFIVSRMFVACCSYTCIRKDLEKRGFKWEKGYDIEALVEDPEVYNGNEPIWIREPLLSKAHEILETLLGKDLAKTSNPPYTSSENVQLEQPSSLTKDSTDTSLSPPITTMLSDTLTVTTKSSRKKKQPQKITFVD